MKVRDYISTYRVRQLTAVVLSISAIGCGVEEQDLLGPQVPVNPFINTIAYGAYAGLGGLVLSNADGTQRSVIGSDDSITSAMWSPDKQSIAYIRLRSFLPGHVLKVSRADGTGTVTLAEGIRGAHLSPGCWSPDGSRLVFDGGPNNLIVISAVTGALDFVMPGAIRGSFVTDSTVVCQLVQNDNLDSTVVGLLNIGSGLLTGLAIDAGGTYFLARTSPARDKIAYVFAADGDFDKTNEIWIMNTDGTEKRRLAVGGGEYLQGRIREMRFSPDGTKMLFVPDWGNLTRVHVLNTLTGGAYELPDATALPWARCDWSPGSDRIVFSHRQGGICVINDDGTGVVRIDSLGEDPAW